MGNIGDALPETCRNNNLFLFINSRGSLLFDYFAISLVLKKFLRSRFPLLLCILVQHVHFLSKPFLSCLVHQLHYEENEQTAALFKPFINTIIPDIYSFEEDFKVVSFKEPKGKD